MKVGRSNNGTLIVSISMASTSGGDDGDGEMVVWC
jgi:hypothetical protein